VIIKTDVQFHKRSKRHLIYFGGEHPEYSANTLAEAFDVAEARGFSHVTLIAGARTYTLEIGKPIAEVPDERQINLFDGQPVETPPWQASPSPQRAALDKAELTQADNGPSD